MRGKHLCAIILIMQILSVFQAKGQDQVKDTILIPSSLQNKTDLQINPAQPSIHYVIPKPGNNDNGNPQGISIDRKVANLNFDQKLKYPVGLARDSLYLPVYPGLGDYQNFGGTLGNFRLAHLLALDYGAFVSVQYGYLFSTKQIVLGSNFLLRYAITNKLQLQTWGQYVIPGNSSDPTFNIRNYFPKTNFGAGLQYYSNEKVKIRVGIEYQLDQSDKIWKPESGGKVLLKF
jgi:hypothetical protein